MLMFERMSALYQTSINYTKNLTYMHVNLNTDLYVCELYGFVACRMIGLWHFDDTILQVDSYNNIGD